MISDETESQDSFDEEDYQTANKRINTGEPESQEICRKRYDRLRK